jgi:hypothetical protein
MRKLNLIIASLVMVTASFVLVACGSNNSTNNTAKPKMITAEFNYYFTENRLGSIVLYEQQDKQFSIVAEGDSLAYDIPPNPAPYTWDGVYYEFSHWLPTPTGKIDTTTIFKAQYNNFHRYTATFRFAGHTETVTVKEGDTPEFTPVVPDADWDFHFLGWDKPIEPITGNITYTADYGIIYKEGVTAVKPNAFKDATNMKAVTLPSTLTEIGEDAFWRCTGLTEIIFPDGLTTIGNYAFYGCTGLTEIIFPDGAVTIGNYAFQNCTGLTEITLPDGAVTIGNYAFQNCTGLEDINLPAGVTLGTNSFNGCTVKTLTINGNMPAVTASPFANINSADGFDLYLGSGVTEISNNLFTATNVKRVLFVGANNLTAIGERAFYNCQKLESFDLSNVVTVGYATFYNDKVLRGANLISAETIGNMAFYSCIAIDTVTFGDNLVSIGYSAFMSAYFTSITLPNSLTAIGEQAFYGNINLTGEISVPAGATFTASSFDRCQKVTKISIDGDCNAETDSFKLIDGVLYNKDITELLFVPMGRNEKLIMPNTVTTLSKSLFDGCRSLQEVELSTGLTNLPESLFNDSGLTKIVIPQNIKSIGKFAFWGCANLETVVIESTTGFSMGEGAFRGCSKLGTLIVHATTNSSRVNLLKEAFYNVGGSLSVPSTLKIYFAGDKAQYGSSVTTRDSSTHNYDMPFTVVYFSAVPVAGAWHFDSDGVTPIIWE